MFLKNKNIIFKIRRSKVTDYAALIVVEYSSDYNNKGSDQTLLEISYRGSIICDVKRSMIYLYIRKRKLSFEYSSIDEMCESFFIPTYLSLSLACVSLLLSLYI